MGSESTVSVNSVKHSPNRPLSGESTRNCAACTAAGAVNLTVGQSVESSGMVAKARGAVDGQLAMGEDVAAQKVRIADHVQVVTARTPVHSRYELSLTDAILWMKEQPHQTVFAVLATGMTNFEDGQQRCHWLNAIKLANDLTFIDFQCMREPTREIEHYTLPGRDQPGSSTKPFVAILTQSMAGATNHTMHAADQTGSFKDDVKLYLIAFPPR